MTVRHTAVAAIAAVLTVSISPSVVAFARPLSSRVVFAATTSRGGGSDSSSSSSSTYSSSSSTPGRCTSSALNAVSTGGTLVNENNVIITIPTSPIEGMRPGTSGLRKKVEIWMGKHYIENFIQCLIDTAMASNGGQMLDTIVVAGDGRYYNNEAIQTIARLLAANGIRNIWIPQHGIMSTPAVSAVIRRRTIDGNGKDGDGIAQGGIVLTASHNPGGPGEDFGIKYNEGLGQPAGEEFTESLYERTLELGSYKILANSPDLDLTAPVGTTYQLTTTSTVTIIDPYRNYVDALQSCFNFDQLRTFGQRKGFSLLFDGMHGAGGPFAKRVLVQELGLSESCLIRCNPLPDFGTCHPDPNLTYASELVSKMGLLSDGSANPTILDSSTLPTLGAANDGDGDRNLIAGAGFFVTPSDSMALIADNWEAIPQFAGGLKGVARSMPSSAALDVVAKARNIHCFVTPTGWKFFGNLMSSKESFGGTNYSPFLCGEESFGTGSDHIREKDGLWAVLAWMSILSKANDGNNSEILVGVKDIVHRHWAKYGRHFYSRYDYEGVDSDAANKVMNVIQENFVHGDTALVDQNDLGIELVDAVEFSYTDPVDGSQTSKQGLVLNFKVSTGDPARVVFRLSGTGSSGATVRMYLEQYEKDTSKHNMSAPAFLKDLADVALGLVQMKQITGRDSPTVIT